MRIFFGALLALAVAAAGALDVIRPAEPRAPEPLAVTSSGGTYGCPVARSSSGKGYLHVGNAGQSPSKVSVTFVTDAGSRKTVQLLVPGLGARTIAVHDEVRAAAGAIVEYAGGEIVASHSVVLSGGRGLAGRGSAPCTRPGPDRLVMLQGATAGAETYLSLLNTGEGDAVVAVTLVAGDTVIRAERLRQRIVPARSRVTLRLSDYAFDRPDLAAVVTMRTGRVVAEALYAGRAGVELLPAHEAAPSVVVFAGEERRNGTIAALLPRGEEAEVDARLLSSEEQMRAPGVPSGLTVLETMRRAVPREPAGPVAYVFESHEGEPLAAAARWTAERAGGRETGASAAAVTAERWAGIATALEGRIAAVRLLLANPGTEAVSVRFTPLGKTGALPAITIEPGRVAKVVLGREAGMFGAVVDADAPVAVALETVGVGGGSLWSSAMPAVPLVPPPPVAVTLNPRLGVPATLRRAEP